MNHTPNYALSQWERTDKVLMEDFNADNAKLDGALKAEADARTALAETVSRQGSTLSSHTASLAKLGNCQVYTTTYTGDGGATRSLSFPAYPVFVFVQLAGYTPFIIFTRNGECAAGAYGNVKARPSWWSRGLSWTMDGGGTAEMNTINDQYAVFALLSKSQ